ncbi:MAG: ABC transporter ATP-binding protein [Lachnospiraceae bacterium]|nr:ABC transporter ATP-binding protein [Lachnospiraceae bacterium]
MLKFCRGYIYKRPKLFFSYIVTVILKTVMSYAGIILSGKFIDILISGSSVKSLLYYCLAFAGIEVFGLALNAINGYIGSILQTKLAYSLNCDLYRKMTRLPLSFINAQDMAYLSQRINVDSNTCISFFLDTYIALYVMTLSMVVSFAMILKIEYKTALILLGLAILYGVIYKAFKKPIYTRAKEYKESSAEFFGKYYECMDGTGFAKRHFIVGFFLSRLDKTYGKLLKSFLSYQKVQISMGLSEGVISTASSILIYVICGIAILNGKVTVGLFTIVLNLFGNLVGAVKFYLEYGKTYQETRVSYNRIENLINLKDETVGDIMPDGCDSIELKNVSFGYDKTIIDNFSYKFTKGNVYYIVGSNGRGKTTLLNLILGNYIDSMRGNVYINGWDIATLDMNSLKRTLIGYSEQDTFLVSGTVRENLEIFKSDDALVKRYADTFRLCNPAKENGLKLETPINIQCNNLSGGEKQKISIIRQFVLNPEVMIFDEPTASLEPDMKAVFSDTIEQLKKEKIVIIVTHDVGIIKDGDIVVNI